MHVFNPKRGLKPILQIIKFTSLILTPTFFILFFTSSVEGILIAVPLIYGFVILISYLIQFTIRYWIDKDQFHYSSMHFFKGSVDIHSIYKLHINTKNYVSQMPATSKTDGISIYYNKFDELYISPENNEELVKALLAINPNIQIVAQNKSV